MLKKNFLKKDNSSLLYDIIRSLNALCSTQTSTALMFNLVNYNLTFEIAYVQFTIRYSI